MKQISSLSFADIKEIILEELPLEETKKTLDFYISLLYTEAKITCEGQDVTEFIKNKAQEIQRAEDFKNGMVRCTGNPDDRILDKLIEKVLTNTLDRQGLFVVKTYDKAGCGDIDLKKFNSLKKALLYCANELKRLESWSDSDRFTFYFNENGCRAEDRSDKYNYGCTIEELF